MLSAEDKLLIDRYLDNSLTGIELRDFLARIDSDEEFKQEVSFHNKLVEGLQKAEDQRLADLVIAATRYKKKLVPFSLKLIFTFLFITLTGIILWEYIGPGSTVKHNYFSWNFIRKKNSPEPQGVIPVTPSPVPEKINEKPIQSDTFSTDTVTEPEIVVKKDQLLISYELQPIQLSPKAQPVSNTDESDPESGLPETKESKKIEVEFWISPVNYKGYKLQNDKLILFGIEVPDEVQLYYLNDNLWMKYGNDFFPLQSGDNYESLLQVAQIPVELK